MFFNLDHCKGLEACLRGYIDICHDFNLLNIEAVIFNYARSKLRYHLKRIINDDFFSFEEAWRMRQTNITKIASRNCNSTIMIADDDYCSRSSLVYMMKYNGYHNIIEVENGQEVF